MTGNQSPLLFPAFFVLAAFVHPLRAELKWDVQKIDLKPRPTDTVAEAKFGFVNAGVDALTIESVKSSCGCTVPILEKTSYANEGELRADAQHLKAQAISPPQQCAAENGSGPHSLCCAPSRLRPRTGCAALRSR